MGNQKNDLASCGSRFLGTREKMWLHRVIHPKVTARSRFAARPVPPRLLPRHGNISYQTYTAMKALKLPNLAFCLLPLAFSLLPFHTSAKAEKKNEYANCAEALMQVNVPPPMAATTCGERRRPQDLASCVVDIATKTDIVPIDALGACRRVRRPLAMAACVVDIGNLSDASDGPDILDHCRRSLIPDHFSTCVVGLKEEIDLATSQAMTACINASDRMEGLPEPEMTPEEQTPSPITPPPSEIPST